MQIYTRHVLQYKSILLHIQIKIPCTYTLVQKIYIHISLNKCTQMKIIPNLYYFYYIIIKKVLIYAVEAEHYGRKMSSLQCNNSPLVQDLGNVSL